MLYLWGHHTLGHHSIPISPYFPNFPSSPYFCHSTRPRLKHCPGSYSSCVRLFSSRTWSQTTFCNWTQKWSHFLSHHNYHQEDSQFDSHQVFPPRKSLFLFFFWQYWIRFFLMTSSVDIPPVLRISFGTLWTPHIGRGSHLMSEALIFRRNRRNLALSNVRVQSEVDFVKLFSITVQNLNDENTILQYSIFIVFWYRKFTRAKSFHPRFTTDTTDKFHVWLLAKFQPFPFLAAPIPLNTGSCPISDSLWSCCQFRHLTHHLQDSSSVVDCPTQLICTWIFICYHRQVI